MKVPYIACRIHIQSAAFPPPCLAAASFSLTRSIKARQRSRVGGPGVGRSTVAARHSATRWASRNRSKCLWRVKAAAPLARKKKVSCGRKEDSATQRHFLNARKTLQGKHTQSRPELSLGCRGQDTNVPTTRQCFRCANVFDSAETATCERILRTKYSGAWF